MLHVWLKTSKRGRWRTVVPLLTRPARRPSARARLPIVRAAKRLRQRSECARGRLRQTQRLLLPPACYYYCLYYYSVQILVLRSSLTRRRGSHGSPTGSYLA